jgi:hypothetical protein
LLADSGHAQKRFEGAGNDYLSLLVGSSRGLNRFLGLRRIAGSQEASNKAEAYGERKLQKEGRSASGTLHGPNLRVSFRISIYSPTGHGDEKQIGRHSFQTIDLIQKPSE